MAKTKWIPSSARGVLSVGLVLVLFVGACSSSDSDDAETPPADTESDVDTPTDEGPADETAGDETPAPDDESEGGTATAVLTFDDGTVFDVELRTCDTADTDSSSIPLEGGYDLSGSSADGYDFSAHRLGFDGEVATSGAYLEMESSDDTSADVLYSVVADTLDLVADGDSVTGTFSLSPIGPNRPFGDLVGATLDAKC